MRLHARHGWAYDAGLWAALDGLLGGICGDDRGYYGPARSDPIDAAAPYVLIGHSFGAMRMLDEIGPGCRGLVAINGFDRFTAAPGFPGVAARVVDRMVQRCASDPAGTTADFRARCGDPGPLPCDATLRLHDDLLLLLDADRRFETGLPLLRLDGAADPILLPAHRAACFGGAPPREIAGGGHLLPATHPRLCADAIAAFVATLV